MVIAIVVVIVSFFLDSLLSNFGTFSLVNPSIFSTIYSIIALVIIHPYFGNKKKFLYILFVVAVLFDIVYTGTFILHIVIFFLIYELNEFADFFLAVNLLNTNIRSIISVIVYHLLSFIVLSVVGYNDYAWSLLLTIVTHSILMTIIYTTVVFLIVSRIFDKYNIKQIK